MKLFIFFVFLFALAYALPILNITQYDDDDEKIRHCTCEEADECVTESYPALKECRKGCKAQLQYFGSSTASYAECFPPNKDGEKMLSSCFKKNIDGYCNTDANSTTFIDKPDYNQTTADKELDGAIEVVKTIRGFHYCAGKLLKEKIVACYQRKNCGVYIPPNYDIAKPGLFCPALKSMVYSNSVKAYTCIMYTNLIG